MQPDAVEWWLSLIPGPPCCQPVSSGGGGGGGGGGWVQVPFPMGCPSGSASGDSWSNNPSTNGLHPGGPGTRLSPGGGGGAGPGGAATAPGTVTSSRTQTGQRQSGSVASESYALGGQCAGAGAGGLGSGRVAALGSGSSFRGYSTPQPDRRLVY